MTTSGDTTPVVIVPYDPTWPTTFTVLADEVARTVGDIARHILHVGSTSVPDLAAKPIIDIVLLVDHSADESYIAPLTTIGYDVAVREPQWFQHRMLKRPGVNLHVYSVGCDEVDRLLLFRDWLRDHPEDRDLYERSKRDLADRQWLHVQDYADAKTPEIASIMGRAQTAMTTRPPRAPTTAVRPPPPRPTPRPTRQATSRAPARSRPEAKAAAARSVGR